MVGETKNKLRICLWRLSFHRGMGERKDLDVNILACVRLSCFYSNYRFD